MTMRLVIREENKFLCIMIWILGYLMFYLCPTDCACLFNKQITLVRLLGNFKQPWNFKQSWNLKLQVAGEICLLHFLLFPLWHLKLPKVQGPPQVLTSNCVGENIKWMISLLLTTMIKEIFLGYSGRFLFCFLFCFRNSSGKGKLSKRVNCKWWNFSHPSGRKFGKWVIQGFTGWENSFCWLV